MSDHRRSRHAVVARSAGGTVQSAVVREHVVVTDQPVRAGGTDQAPTPLELLSVALANCVMLYVHRFCVAESLDPEGLEVEVTPFWREDPGRIGRFQVTVHLPDTIPEGHRVAIEDVARKCPVHHTFTHMPEVTLQVQTLVPEGVAP
jgi:putative redox protein